MELPPQFHQHDLLRQRTDLQLKHSLHANTASPLLVLKCLSCVTVGVFWHDVMIGYQSVGAKKDP